jgi:hypothetical protein
MTVSAPLVECLLQTLDALRRGPASLTKRIRVNAAAEDLTATEAEVDALLDLLVGEDANHHVRIEFHQRLTAWDHLEAPAWADGTLAHTPERRARIHALLDWSSERIERCDALFPVVALKLPTVIATEHEDWYDDHARVRNFYWTAYANHLETRVGWPTSSVQQLEVDATSVVSRLSNPHRSEAFAARGLVVGYVQSGKTANFTAVIAKAADAGYRLFIVLTGMLDILRAQTQRRLDKELIGWEMCDGEEGNYAHDDDRDEFIRHGGLPSGRGAFDWDRLTDANDDYKGLGHGVTALRFNRRDPSKPLFHPENLHANEARIIVVKKNKQVLEKLRRDLAVYRKDLEDVPALVIDDESDQASPSTAKAGRPPTAINLGIRRILELLPRGQYVGYTATPFANVFIDPAATQDLFPRDFVISLQRPTGYMGLREFFDIDVDNLAPRNADGNPFVHGVEGDDADEQNLPAALDLFLLTGAVKLFREAATSNDPLPLRFKHHTMLVHCSAQQLAHMADRDKVLEVLAGAGWDKARGRRRLRKLWNEEVRPTCLAQGADLPLPSNFEELDPFLNECRNRLHKQVGNSQDPVLIVNGDERSATTPNFEKESVWKVLVGGNKLSRGYTVEGLTVSYYRRPARTADTLMQMGRWFGFRRGFHDLCRLFVGTAEPGNRKGTTVNLAEAFVDTCIMEEEFRRDLQKYAGQIEPRHLYPLVRAVLKQEKRLDPNVKDISMSDVSMLPTAANKMQNTEIVGRNFGGDKFEVTQAPNKTAAIHENAEAFRKLLSITGLQAVDLDLKVQISAGTSAKDQTLRAKLWHATAALGDVRTFLETYRWYDEKPLASEVIAYLKRPVAETNLARWRIAVLDRSGDKYGPWSTGITSPKTLSVIGRSRPTPNRFNIYQAPEDVVFAEYLAGWADVERRIKGNITQGIKALRDDKCGVLLAYLVRELDGASTEVNVGFVLRFPGNSSPTKFFFTARGQRA